MTDAEIARKLRLAESAAASAILNGATAEQVRAAIEAGIADGLRLNERSMMRRDQPAEPPTRAPGGRHSAPDPNSALGRLAAAVGGVD